MKEELEKKLMNDYPELYSDKDKPPTQSLMCFGFEVGDGWYNIIESLSKCIKFYVVSRIENEMFLRRTPSFSNIFTKLRHGPKSWILWTWYRYIIGDILKSFKEYIKLLLRKPIDIESMQIRAIQVKEKFGGLRFYIGGADYEAHAMIQMAEIMSLVTCEQCGNPGSLHHRNGWLKTLCPKCAKKISGYKKCSKHDPETTS
jgi:hypothetical protein